jgi:amidohydrolase
MKSPKSLFRIVASATLIIGFLPGGASAQVRDADRRIAAIVQEITPDLIAVRRDIHAYPELSTQETRTAALVAERFQALGLEVRTGIAGTGVLGILRGGKPGPVVGLRGDMDALPITEDTGLPFASTVRAVRDGRETGVMHACGHDIHTTVLMGIATVLARLRNDVAGTVLFIAQPAEESVGGAARMLKEGVFRDVKPAAMYSLHVDDSAPAGVIKYVPGFVMANVDSASLSVLSEGGHGAHPSACVDPIVVASQIVVALQVMIARQIDLQNDTVITVGSFHAGTVANIIPERADLKVTIRTYGDDQRKLVREKIERTIAGICGTAGAKYELNYAFGTPATYNDPSLTTEAVAVAERILGKDKVVKDVPGMGGEDFSYFGREIPAVMIFVGVEPKGATATVHSPFFVADEDGIAVGVRVLSAVLLDKLDRLRTK